MMKGKEEEKSMTQCKLGKVALTLALVS